jgi:hypothetical protein
MFNLYNFLLLLEQIFSTKYYPETCRYSRFFPFCIRTTHIRITMEKYLFCNNNHQPFRIQLKISAILTANKKGTSFMILVENISISDNCHNHCMYSSVIFIERTWKGRSIIFKMFSWFFVEKVEIFQRILVNKSFCKIIPCS